MSIKELIKKLKKILFKVRRRKYKLTLLEKNLRSMRQLAVEIKENGEHFTPDRRAEIKNEFNSLLLKVKGLEAELKDDKF